MLTCRIFRGLGLVRTLRALLACRSCWRGWGRARWTPRGPRQTGSRSARGRRPEAVPWNDCILNVVLQRSWTSAPLHFWSFFYCFRAILCNSQATTGSIYFNFSKLRCDWTETQAAFDCKRSGARSWSKNFGLKICLKNGLRCHFDSMTCLNYPFSTFFQYRKSKAVFQAKNLAWKTAWKMAWDTRSMFYKEQPIRDKIWD